MARGNSGITERHQDYQLPAKSDPWNPCQIRFTPPAFHCSSCRESGSELRSCGSPSYSFNVTQPGTKLLLGVDAWKFQACRCLEIPLLMAEPCAESLFIPREGAEGSYQLSFLPFFPVFLWQNVADDLDEVLEEGDKRGQKRLLCKRSSGWEGHSGVGGTREI